MRNLASFGSESEPAPLVTRRAPGSGGNPFFKGGGGHRSREKANGGKVAKWQGRSAKKPTGGRIWPSRGKRKREFGGEFIEARLGPTKRVQRRASGGGIKISSLGTDVANVVDPKTGQAKKSKILTVIENPADPHFIRRNVLTKGAIIETELGRARVTSRPGQSGAIDALLLEAKPVEAEKPPPPEKSAEEKS